MNNFMQIAIEEAKKSGKDVPVGAAVVYDGKIITSAHNQKEELNDVSAHAEIIAIKNAEKILKNWRLDGAELYVTLEPCPMCATAIINSRISKVYYGAGDNLYGAFGGAIDLRKLFNSKLIVNGGIEEEECEKLLKGFWKRNG